MEKPRETKSTRLHMRVHSDDLYTNTHTYIYMFVRNVYSLIATRKTAPLAAIVVLLS